MSDSGDRLPVPDSGTHCQHDRFHTTWDALGEDYYLCCVWDSRKLRHKVYVGGDGEIRTTFLRADRDEDAAMLAQVSDEAPEAVARLYRPAPKSRREKQREHRPRRPMPARYPGICVRTGRHYAMGDLIVWTTGGWMIAERGDGPGEDVDWQALGVTF